MIPIALLILAILFDFGVVSGDGTVSMTQFSAYLIQRSCVQDCLLNGNPDGSPNLRRELECSSPPLDDCYCRSDLAQTASIFLSSCVSSWCPKNTIDIKKAQSLYAAYCASSLSAVGYASSASLGSAAAYSSLRGCAKGCLWSRPSNGDPSLAGFLQCPAKLNDCFCRSDLSATASSFITGCVNQWCEGNTEDIRSAISVYRMYCASTTLGALPTSTNAEPKSNSNTDQPVPGMTSAPSPQETAPQNSGPTSSSGSSTSGIDNGTKIGIIVGVLSLVVAVIGVGVAIWAAKTGKYPKLMSVLHIHQMQTMPHTTPQTTPQPIPQTYTYNTGTVPFGKGIS